MVAITYEFRYLYMNRKDTGVNVRISTPISGLQFFTVGRDLPRKVIVGTEVITIDFFLNYCSDWVSITRWGKPLHFRCQDISWVAAIHCVPSRRWWLKGGAKRMIKCLHTKMRASTYWQSGMPWFDRVLLDPTSQNKIFKYFIPQLHDRKK